MTLTTRVSILKWSALILMIAFGPVLALSAIEPFGSLTHWFIMLARLETGQVYLSEPGGVLMAAILGGILTGFGVCMWQVTSKVYARDPVLGRSIMLPAIVTWFVIDGVGSVLAGAWFNVVLNSVFLACFLTPLLWPWPQGVRTHGA